MVDVAAGRGSMDGLAREATEGLNTGEVLKGGAKVVARRVDGQGQEGHGQKGISVLDVGEGPSEV